MANGPPIYRNLSLGAVTATVVNPPTTPAVYQAALLIAKHSMLNKVAVKGISDFKRWMDYFANSAKSCASQGRRNRESRQDLGLSIHNLKTKLGHVR